MISISCPNLAIRHADWTSPPVSKTWFIVGRDGGKAAQPIQLSLKINAVNGVSGGQEGRDTPFSNMGKNIHKNKIINDLRSCAYLSVAC